MIPMPRAPEHVAADRADASGPGGHGWLVLWTALVIEQLAEVPADTTAWWAVAGAGGWVAWALLLRRLALRIPQRWSPRGRAAALTWLGTSGFAPPVAVTATTAALALPTLAGGDGASPEGVLLAVLRGMLVAGVVVGTSAAQTAFTIASTVFVVTLSTIVVAHPQAGFATAAYALAACTWLAVRRGSHARVRVPPPRAHIGLPWRPSGIGAALFVAATVVAMGAGHDAAGRAIAGWMPFSGGDSWAFPWARDGVGDGENLVAARTKPQATGPVTSGMFLNSHQPSIFDMFDDRYGEPLKKRAQRRERAIGLDIVQRSDDRSHVHFADSEHAGREFSTLRRASRQRRPTANIAARAIVSVTGPMPVHLRLEVFDRFDGTHWLPPRAAGEATALEHVGGDWMRWAGRSAPVAAGPAGVTLERHDVTIGTHRTPALPLPTLPTRLRIDRVDRADFFRTPAPEVATLDGVDVPAGTTVQVESVVDGIDARHWPPGLPAVAARDGMPPWVLALAADWGLSDAGAQPGDFAVAARVVAELARRCVLDPDAAAPVDCDDTLRHFLLDSRRGPAFCFAGAATLLLRACGYQSRLAGGIHLSGARRDTRSRRCIAIADDAHVWAEVADRAGRWIPVEATPGVRLRLPAVPWWQRIGAFMRDRLVGMQPPSIGLVALVIAAVLGLIVSRTWRSLADAAATAAWRLAVARTRACPLTATWRLLEWRSWLAGYPRPAHETARGWYVEACGGPAAPATAGFITALEAIIYGPRQGRPICRDRDRHLQLARDAVATLTREALGAGRRQRTGTRPTLQGSRAGGCVAAGPASAGHRQQALVRVSA